MTLRTAAAPARSTFDSGRGLSSGMPLLILFYGFPLWWVLGFGQLAFLIAALPMALHLWRIRRALTVPRGFVLWLFFLLIVLVSAFTLPARAPFAVGTGNFLTYGYRLGWYISVTIALLYVGNLAPQWVRSRRIPDAVAFMFLVTVAGGWLGILAPDWQADSLLGHLLPSALAKNPFVSSLVTLDAADTQDVLGYAEARPKAPFAYANSWGASFSAFLPFFVYAWCRRGSGWRLFAAPWVLLASAFVVVATLNRALWGTLIVGCIYAGVQLIRFHGRRGFVAVYGALVAIVVLVVLSGLGATIGERLDNPHSDDRRSELAVKTVESVASGSPLIGFGNTRDVKGGFDSIAGGETPDCPACGVPPFGTQGQLWLVLFAQGMVGAAAFVSFVIYRLSRHIRSRDTRTVILLAGPIFLLLQIPFYDTLGIPLFTTMIGLALMWRAQDHLGRIAASSAKDAAVAPRSHRSDSVRATVLAAAIARDFWVVAAGGLALAIAGAVMAMLATPVYRATVDVLVNPAPVVLQPGTEAPRLISVDTEGQWALSDDVMLGITEATGDTNPRASTRVSAFPNTKVLRLSYASLEPRLAEEGARAFGEGYVGQRSEYLDARASAALDRLLPVDAGTDARAGINASGRLADQAWAATLANREARLLSVISASPVAAEVLRGPVVFRERRNLAAIVGNSMAMGILMALGAVVLRREWVGSRV